MKKTFSLLLAMMLVLLALGAVPALAEKTVGTY